MSRKQLNSVTHLQECDVHSYMTLHAAFQSELTSLMKRSRHVLEPSPEHIHQLRVRIKRMRAQLKFFTKISKSSKPAKKVENMLEKVFVTAGEARAIQVDLETMAKLKLDLPQWKAHMLRTLAPLRVEVAKKTKLLYTRQFRSDIKTLLSEMKKTGRTEVRKTALKLVKKKFKNIRSHASKAKEKRFHTIRKKVKHVIYVSPLTSNKPIHIKALKRVEKHVGAWHDLLVFSTSLQGFLTEHPRSKGISDAIKKTALVIAKEKKKTQKALSAMA